MTWCFQAGITFALSESIYVYKTKRALRYKNALRKNV